MESSDNPLPSFSKPTLELGKAKDVVLLLIPNIFLYHHLKTVNLAMKSDPEKGQFPQQDPNCCCATNPGNGAGPPCCSEVSSPEPRVSPGLIILGETCAAKKSDPIWGAGSKPK